MYVYVCTFDILPKVPPLPLYTIFDRKGTPFRIPSIAKGTPFKYMYLAYLRTLLPRFKNPLE